MSVIVEIPDEVARSLRLPEPERAGRLKLELACALYERGLLSCGKAAELAGVSRFLFGLELGKRGIERHYTEKELEQDLAYARGEQHLPAE